MATAFVQSSLFSANHLNVPLKKNKSLPREKFLSLNSNVMVHITHPLVNGDIFLDKEAQAHTKTQRLITDTLHVYASHLSPLNSAD